MYTMLKKITTFVACFFILSCSSTAIPAQAPVKERSLTRTTALHKKELASHTPIAHMSHKGEPLIKKVAAPSIKASQALPAKAASLTVPSSQVKDKKKSTNTAIQKKEPITPAPVTFTAHEEKSARAVKKTVPSSIKVPTKVASLAETTSPLTDKEDDVTVQKKELITPAPVTFIPHEEKSARVVKKIMPSPIKTSPTLLRKAASLATTASQITDEEDEDDIEDDNDDDEDDLLDDSDTLGTPAYYKALALRAEELMNNSQYNEAIPLIVTLLKRTGGEHLTAHTETPLDERLTRAVLFDAGSIRCKKAKAQFKRLTSSDTNTYAQAQADVWLGTLRYLERGCVKNRRKAKKYFKRAINLGVNKRAAAEARLALGILYSFQKNPFSRKMLTNKNFQERAALLRAQGMEYLKQAQNQNDSKVVARSARDIRNAIIRDIKQAYLDFKLKTGTFKKM